MPKKNHLAILCAKFMHAKIYIISFKNVYHLYCVDLGDKYFIFSEIWRKTECITDCGLVL